MKKLGFLVLFLVIKITAIWAQDPQFSQFLASPTLLNPAFTGSEHQHRVGIHYRNQWPEIKKAFVSYVASYDTYISDMNSGVGFRISYDRAGSGALSFVDAAGSFAYEFKLNDNWSVRPGVNVGIYRRYVDYSRLVFSDQLVRGSTDRNSVDYSEENSKVFFNVDAGGLLYNKHFWLGFSSRHVNSPSESLLTINRAELPSKMSLHGGARLVLDRTRKGAINRALWFAFQAKDQNISRQLDVGVYTEFHPVTFGLWYRGIDLGKSDIPAYSPQDALVISLGVEYLQVRVGYSYDITISGLTGYSGGTHEVSINIVWPDDINGKGKRETIPCPKL